MSTRCVINFHYASTEEPAEAKVYKHDDGYPEALHPLFQEFFISYEQAGGDRFNDPSYLAAQFIIWRQLFLSRVSCGPEPYIRTGLGVIVQDPPDIDYLWHVVCPEDGRPEVYWQTARANDEGQWTYGPLKQGPHEEAQ